MQLPALKNAQLMYGFDHLGARASDGIVIRESQSVMSHFRLRQSRPSLRSVDTPSGNDQAVGPFLPLYPFHSLRIQDTFRKVILAFMAQQYPDAGSVVMPTTFFLAMFVLPAAIVGMVVVLVLLTRRSEDRSRGDGL